MAEEEVVKVRKLVIDGDNAPLNAPLTVHMEYDLARPLAGAVWELIYEADMANKRQAITLASSAPTDLAAGSHQYQHSAPDVKTGDIKKKYLLQVGLLKLTLHAANEPNVTSVNMVTQVTEGGDGVLLRSIMNPTEE
jgi:hypothetical protein